jgi:hypothetical protein
MDRINGINAAIPTERTNPTARIGVASYIYMSMYDVVIIK